MQVENGLRIALLARLSRNDASHATANTPDVTFARGVSRLITSLLCALLLAATTALVAQAADTRDAATFFNLNMGDFKTELADAKAEGKKALFVMFEQEGCPYCAFMKRNILNRKDVQDFYHANFSNLALDIHSSVPLRDFANREQTEKAFAQASRVRVTPTMVFYDLAGNEIMRIAGTVERPDEFLLLGEFVATGAYKTRSFTQYKADKPARKGS